MIGIPVQVYSHIEFDTAAVRTLRQVHGHLTQRLDRPGGYKVIFHVHEDDEWGHGHPSYLGLGFVGVGSVVYLTDPSPPPEETPLGDEDVYDPDPDVVEQA